MEAGGRCRSVHTGANKLLHKTPISRVCTGEDVNVWPLSQGFAVSGSGPDSAGSSARRRAKPVCRPVSGCFHFICRAPSCILLSSQHPCTNGTLNGRGARGTIRFPKALATPMQPSGPKQSSTRSTHITRKTGYKESPNSIPPKTPYFRTTATWWHNSSDQ